MPELADDCGVNRIGLLEQSMPFGKVSDLPWIGNADIDSGLMHGIDNDMFIPASGFADDKH